MKVTRVIVGVLGVVVASGAGCGGSVARTETEPVITVAPDYFAMRDVQKDAARHLKCQVPMVSVERDAWAGSRGNVIATGCGFHITYYVACETSHLCHFTIAE